MTKNDVILRRLADEESSSLLVASRRFDWMLHFIQHDRKKRRNAGILMRVHGKPAVPGTLPHTDNEQSGGVTVTSNE
jgi:hypothetical protein